MVELIKAAQKPSSPAEVVLVISNRPEAAGLKKAKTLGVEAICIDHKAYTTRKDFERALDNALVQKQVELICNAGFMRLLSPWFVGRWQGRQLNIHPSLLPKYPGLHTHERVLQAGDSEHGCTIHLIDEGMDTGEIIAQAEVPVLAGDTPETLAARVLKAEHRLYPKVLIELANRLTSSK